MAGFERVLLYIGAPKTGTTTVQNILRKSRPSLMKQGFYAPTAGRGGTGQHIELPAIVLSGEQRDDLDRHFNVKGETKETRRRHFIQSLDRELALVRGCHTLLFFSEHMFYSDAIEVPAYGEMFAPYAPRFESLMYLRRQDRWLASLSLQIRKTDASRGLELDVGDPHDYGERVRAWDAASDRCHIRRFEPEFLFNGDLLSDFGHAIGLDTSALGASDVRANPSMLQEQVELMDALNEKLTPMAPWRRVLYRQGFIPLCSDALGGARIEFPRAAAKAAFEAYGEINRWLHDHKDPRGPELFFNADFENYCEDPRNDARYSVEQLSTLMSAISRSAPARGMRSPAKPPRTSRAALIDGILSAFISLRRAELRDGPAAGAGVAAARPELA
jgi:hypothetical protein